MKFFISSLKVILNPPNQVRPEYVNVSFLAKKANFANASFIKSYRRREEATHWGQMSKLLNAFRPPQKSHKKTKKTSCFSARQFRT